MQVGTLNLIMDIFRRVFHFHRIICSNGYPMGLKALPIVDIEISKYRRTWRLSLKFWNHSELHRAIELLKVKRTF